MESVLNWSVIISIIGVLVVLTNACGRNDLLTSLIGTLDAVHSGDMRG